MRFIQVRGVDPARPVVVRRLSGFFERARGLLWTERNACPVLIARCSSVHTFGMRYPIDIAFLDEGNRVIGRLRRVAPSRVVGRPGAHAVLERPSTAGPWPEVGDVLSMEGRSGRWELMHG